jgi:amylosucrase
VTYVRCHDDIGWAVSDEDAWTVGFNPYEHRRFLASYFAGRYPGSFARGADFGLNPETGDVRTSGSAASLAGLESALESGDQAAVDAALRRLETMYAVAFSSGGIPLLYMGDELAMLNDDSWDADPAHADDNRWLHRPALDWTAAERRTDPTTVEGRMFAAVQRLAAARRSTPSLRSDAETRYLRHHHPRVLAYVRSHPRAAPVLCVACFSDDEEVVDAAVLHHAGITSPVHLHSSTGELTLRDGALVMPAWGFAWLSC